MSSILSQHGYVISIDNAGGTPVNISSTCGPCEIDPSKGLGLVHSADSGFQKTVESPVKACSVSVSVLRTSGTTEAYKIFNDWYMEANPAVRTLTIDWPDSSAGSSRLTGEFSLQSFQAARRNPGVGDAEVLQAVLQSDGTYTWDDI